MKTSEKTLENIIYEKSLLKKIKKYLKFFYEMKEIQEFLRIFSN